MSSHGVAVVKKCISLKFGILRVMQKASTAVSSEFLMVQMRMQRLVRGHLRPCLCMQLRSVEFNDFEAPCIEDGRRQTRRSSLHIRLHHQDSRQVAEVLRFAIFRVAA